MSFEGQNNSPFLFSDVTANNSAAVLADMNNNLVALVNALTSSSALIAVLEELVTATQAINTTLGTINTTLGVGNSYLNNIHGDLGAINVDLQNIYSAILSGNTNTSNIYSELITINTTLGVGNNNTAAINSDLMAMNGVLGSIDNDLKNINTTIIVWSGNINTTLGEIAADLAPWVVDDVPYTLAQSAYQTAFVDLLPYSSTSIAQSLYTIEQDLSLTSGSAINATLNNSLNYTPLLPPYNVNTFSAAESAFYTMLSFRNTPTNYAATTLGPPLLYTANGTLVYGGISIADILQASLLTDGYATGNVATQNNFCYQQEFGPLAGTYSIAESSLYTAMALRNITSDDPLSGAQTTIGNASFVMGTRPATNTGFADVLGLALFPVDTATPTSGIADIFNAALLTAGYVPALASQNNLCYTNTSVAGNPSFSIAQSLAPFYYADMGDQFSIAGAIFKQADVLNTALLTSGYAPDAAATQNNLCFNADNPDELGMSIAQSLANPAEPNITWQTSQLVAALGDGGAIVMDLNNIVTNTNVLTNVAGTEEGQAVLNVVTNPNSGRDVDPIYTIAAG